MPVFYSTSTNVYVENARHVAEDGDIVLSLSNGDELRHRVPLRLQDGDDPEDYSIHLFRNKFLKERNIFQVFDEARDSDTRIGWLMPIAALESASHQYSSDKYFLHYAKAALWGLWMPVRKFAFRAAALSGLTSSGTVKLTDVYEDDTAVLVLDRRATAKRGVCAKDYWHWLFKFGFSVYGEYDHPARQGDRSTILFEELGKYLIARRIVPCLRDDPFLNSIFNGGLSLSAHPMAAFLIYYQVFELLIERVFQAEKEILWDTIRSARTVPAVRDAASKIQDSVSEEKRLNKLMMYYMAEGYDSAELRLACLNFLKRLNREAEDGFVKRLYSTRNAIVHSLRSVAIQAETELLDVNAELLVVVADVLTSYRDEGSVNEGRWYDL